MANMSEVIEVKIGKRGEIYTTQKIREKVGLVIGGKAIAKIEGDKLIIQPKPSALSLLEKPRIGAKPVTPKEMSKLRRELAEEIEAR
jgi:bifunctional DNA-binding transcriptional regulator/antitoxin component of YhaV-PrlF toxin-antitoxin module